MTWVLICTAVRQYKYFPKLHFAEFRKKAMRSSTYERMIRDAKAAKKRGKELEKERVMFVVRVGSFALPLPQVIILVEANFAPSLPLPQDDTSVWGGGQGQN